MYISILGRQPSIGIAELERLYGDVRWFSEDTATIATSEINLARLGGSQKIGHVIATLPNQQWQQVSGFIAHTYTKRWSHIDHKITLGISSYGFKTSARDVQKIGLNLKHTLKRSNVSLRLIPNDTAALNSASSHHNKLGLSENKVELLLVAGSNGSTIIAESVGAQNITAYAHRDQNRPKRDAFVGMLPPKLAQIMINLSLGDTSKTSLRLLDPFCGTGVILQEASLMGCQVYGTDLSKKMVDYSQINLDWLAETHHLSTHVLLEVGDAMTHIWQHPIDAIATEAYLGQPFSAPPSPAKLSEVRGNCNYIISTFLQNIAQYIASGTPLCIAVPAWHTSDGSFVHLPLNNQLAELGYRQIHLQTVNSNELLYYRDNQVVARELLLIQKI